MTAYNIAKTSSTYYVRTLNQMSLFGIYFFIFNTRVLANDRIAQKRGESGFSPNISTNKIKLNAGQNTSVRKSYLF